MLHLFGCYSFLCLRQLFQLFCFMDLLWVKTLILPYGIVNTTNPRQNYLQKKELSTFIHRFFDLTTSAKLIAYSRRYYTSIIKKEGKSAEFTEFGLIILFAQQIYVYINEISKAKKYSLLFFKLSLFYTLREINLNVSFLTFQLN